MRTRLAGIIPMKNGIALIHRQHVKNREYEEYYVFPGGGLEENETLEQGAIREIKEELGIDVKIVKELYYTETKIAKEHFFLCEYIGGKFGTGDGPEYSGNLKYIESGTYTPEIVKYEDLKNIFLLPEKIKEKILEDLEKLKKCL